MSSERIAIIRLDALGDTLLSTPAIEVLERAVGGQNILVLTSPGMSVIFGDSIASEEVASQESEADIAARIDKFRASTVYVFSEKKKALRAAYLSAAKVRIGFDPGWSQPLRSLETRKYLTLRFSIVNSLSSRSRFHEVDRYCRLVGLGLSLKSVNSGRLRIFPLQGDGPVRDRVLGFQWAKKWLNDGWPESLLTTLLEALPTETAIFVAPEEQEWARSLLPSDREVICCSDLLDYAREVSRCRYLISVDTGAVHIAAATGTPVVDVFPEERSEHTVPRWRPWMTPHKVVLKPRYEPAEVEAFVASVNEARLKLEEVLETMVAPAPS